MSSWTHVFDILSHVITRISHMSKSTRETQSGDLKSNDVSFTGIRFEFKLRDTMLKQYF